MARKITRSSAKVREDGKDTDIEVEAATPALPASSTNPPMLFLLPKDRSPDARIVTLPNPASGEGARFFSDLNLGIYEFKHISTPIVDPCSWLLEPRRVATQTAIEDGAKSPLDTGYMIQDPGLFVATPIDPVFFVLPIVLAQSSMYLSIDDYLDKLKDNSSTLVEVLGQPITSTALSTRMRSICDVVEAGEESMFRVNMSKVALDLLKRAETVVAQGLPASMEQRLVQEALQAPTMSVPSAEAATPVLSEEDPLDQSTAISSTQPASMTSQSSLAAATSFDSQESVVSVSTAATSILDVPEPSVHGEDEAYRLLRLRTALDFILASYIPPALHKSLRDAIATSNAMSFVALDQRLEQLAALRHKAQGLRSISNNISRKRPVDDEIEAIRAEKRRKIEEEEAKRKAQPLAMKKLAKVNTSGMSKMSSFFKKAPAKTST